MFSRFRIPLGLAVLAALLTSVAVLAKGSFSFIAIAGPNLKEPIRSTDPALTTDFFAFADFYRNKAESPADPGVGYEITRYYLDSGRESAFDRLHYYPDTGYVYFDGIVNGSSEYDGKWYTAKPEVREAFMNALPAAAANPKPAEKSAGIQPGASGAQSQPNPLNRQTFLLGTIIVAAGLAAVIALVFRRRRVFAH